MNTLNALVFCLSISPILIWLSLMVFIFFLTIGLYGMALIFIVSLAASFHPDKDLGLFQTLWFALRHIYSIAPSYISSILDKTILPFEFAWNFAKFDHPIIAFLIWLSIFFVVYNSYRK